MRESLARADKPPVAQKRNRAGWRTTRPVIVTRFGVLSALTATPHEQTRGANRERAQGGGLGNGPGRQSGGRERVAGALAQVGVDDGIVVAGHLSIEVCIT